MAKLEEKNLDSTFDKDLHRLIDEIGKNSGNAFQWIEWHCHRFSEHLHASIKANRLDGKIISDLQQVLRSSRWSKDFSVSKGFLGICSHLDSLVDDDDDDRLIAFRTSNSRLDRR